MQTERPPDEDWARFMHEAVQVARSHLEKNAALPLGAVLDILKQTAAPRLVDRARSLSVDAQLHANAFGAPRSVTHKIDVNSGRYAAHAPWAIRNLEQFGQRTSRPDLHPSEPLGNGRLQLQSHSLGFAYEDPEIGRRINLGRLGSAWVQGHDSPSLGRPWGLVHYESAEPHVVPSMLAAANRVFQGVMKDDRTQTEVIGHVAEIYWLLSHAWPYKRGSACIADLSTKLIFDQFGIEVPSFKPDINPNIGALFSSVDRFLVEYPSFFDGELK